MSSREPRLETVRVNVDGCRIFTRYSRGSASNERPPVVLVHGLGVSSRYMIPLARSVARDDTVYAPDMPGFGKSERPGRVYSIDELADTLAGWMDALELDRAVFIANSLGCEVVVELGLGHPGRICGAVLQAPTIDPRRRTAVEQVIRLAADSLFEPITLIPIVVFDYLTAGPRRIWGTFQYMLEHRMEDRLPLFQVPAVVVRGDRDPVVSQRWVEEAADLLPQGRLVVLPEVAHAINYANPAELHALVLGLIDEISIQ